MIEGLTAAVRQHELRATELLQALPVAVYTTDAAGYITAYNDAAAELWGRRPKLGVDRWCGSHRLFWPDGSPMELAESPPAVATGRGEAIEAAEVVAERPDGTRVSFLSFPTPRFDAAGDVVGVVVTLVDITQLKRAEASEQRLVAIVASSHDAIVSKNLNGVITSWNNAAERLFGYDSAEAIGQPITMIIPPDRLGEERMILERIRAGDLVEHFETVRVRKDGRRIPLSLTISPVRANDGTIIGVSKIARDISDQKETEQRVRTLVREVSHRVKNQFAVILSMIRDTKKQARTPDEFTTRVQERIFALSRTHDLLVQDLWGGTTIAELLASHVEPFDGARRVAASGPPLKLQSMALQYLGVAFHELAANSARYGALSQSDGRVEVNWSVDGVEHEAPQFHLVWRERGGPAVTGTEEDGFGRVMLEEIAPAAIDGSARLQYRPEGTVWSLDAPLAQVYQEPLARRQGA